MSEPLHVLLVEDSEDDALLVLRELRRHGFAPVWARVQTAEGLIAALQQRVWDVVISDFRMPRFNAPTALEIVRQYQYDIPFIVVSGTIGETVAVKLMKAGAHDYLMKDNLIRLPEAVRRELRDARIRNEQKRAEAALLRSEAQSRAILGAIPDRMLLVGTDGVCQEVITPPSVTKTYFTQCCPVGLSLQDCMPPEIATRMLYHIEQALQTRQLQVYEQQVHVQGEWLYEEVRIFRSDHDEVLVMIRDISDRKQAEVNLAKRDRYLTALVEIQRLLLTETIDQTLYRRIAMRLGAVAGADRVYIFEKHLDAAGRDRVSQRAEWCAPGIEPQFSNPTLQNLSYDEDLPSLQRQFAQGQPVNGPIADFPEPERSHLAAQGIQSILEIPIVASGEFFGFIGFDDCRTEKRWDALEVEMLRSVATAIALGKEREQAVHALAHLNQELEDRVRQRTAALQESEAKLQAILDSASAAIYVKDVAGRYTLID